MKESPKTKEFLEELSAFLKTMRSLDATEMEWESGEYGFKIALGSLKNIPNPTSLTNGKNESARDEIPIVSPVVGTFHFPDVEIHSGSAVRVKDSLGFVTSVNVEHKVEAEVEGKLSKVHVRDGEPVEFGQVLFTLEIPRVS